MFDKEILVLAKVAFREIITHNPSNQLRLYMYFLFPYLVLCFIVIFISQGDVFVLYKCQCSWVMTLSQLKRIFQEIESKNWGEKKGLNLIIRIWCSSPYFYIIHSVLVFNIRVLHSLSNCPFERERERERVIPVEIVIHNLSLFSFPLPISISTRGDYFHHYLYHTWVLRVFWSWESL